VRKTLVCNAGVAETATVLDTDSVPLSAQGNASFSGSIGSVPAPCENPLFLVRIAAPQGAAGRSDRNRSAAVHQRELPVAVGKDLRVAAPP
jgi:hypothetical protein